MKTTKKHTKYWKERRIDWGKSYLATWKHPHRGLITQILKNLQWHSLWEIGIGGGANIRRILEEIPGKQLGGSDISQDAVDFLAKTFKGGMFHCESGEDILMSDRSVDIMLSDMCLIYVGPTKIKKYLKEMKRVTRNHIILCEFHSESFWKRVLTYFKSGYYVYNYKKILSDVGYHDIMVQRIPKEYWDADNNSEFRTIILASL